MTLRAKALLIIGVGLIALGGAFYLTARLTFTRGLARIEEQEAKGHVERALAVLSVTVTEMERNTADWASWDDTYAFIEDTNPEYIASNLVDSAFTILRLNLMMFVHSSGRIVFGKAFDLDDQEEIPLSPDLLRELADNSLRVGLSGTESTTSGIILLAGEPMLITAQPILTSQGEGPVRGAVLFGRYLDSAELSRLAEITGSRLTVGRVDGELSPDFRKALPSLLTGTPVFVQPLSKQFVAGYSLLKDVDGEPALILRVATSRDIYQLGQVTIIHYLLAALGVGLLAAAVVMWIIQKQILSRFDMLIAGASSIASTGDTSARISLKGKDELALVAGTINGMLGALHEFSADLRERLEQEKTLRQELEAEIQKRAEYTRALVHELKTPVTPVLAAAELLLEEVKEERLRRLVQSIDRSASNLNHRIDELLDLARGETGMLQLALETLDPAPLLREIGQEMALVAEGKGQSMTLDLPASLPNVTADGQRLQQVVLNLLSNALKFTLAGGKITLRARADGANLVVEVSDTGPGISEEDQEHLFQPYHRRAEEKARLSGLGLGLVLSKTFVELHGGRIWVKSEMGKGSTFSFSIPLERTV